MIGRVFCGSDLQKLVVVYFELRLYVIRYIFLYKCQ